MACVSGPLQTGKTSVLAGLANHGIMLKLTSEWKFVTFCKPTFLFISGGRWFRALRGFKEEKEEAEKWLLGINTLLIDDLDKIETPLHGLVREVVVQRQDAGLFTVVSVTDPSALREFDPQVYRRIEDGRQIVLGNKRSGSIVPGPEEPSSQF